MQRKLVSRRAWALLLLVMVTGEFLGCISIQRQQNQRPPTLQEGRSATATLRPTGTRPPPTIPPSTTPTLSATATATATYPASVRQRPFSIYLTETIGERTQQVTLRYLLFLPAGYDTDPLTRWPLILFLHGSGESGSDLNLLKKQMLPKYLESHADFPFIVISPQLPTSGSQSSTMPIDPRQDVEIYGWNQWIDRLNLLVDAIQAGYRVDAGRVFLTGISLGGFGVWNYALRYPKRFAKIVPIAGGYQYFERTIPEQICDLKDLPIWAFHGEMDTSVQVWQSIILVEALKACGGKPRLTIYPDTGHDAWSQAYSDPELYRWLLGQTK